MILPNVSYCEDNNEVHYNPTLPFNIIMYTASSKIPELDSGTDVNGLHVNAFNTTIKSHTFENGVGTIKFNGNVTSVGDWAFNGCSGMTSIEIPNSVTNIGGRAFRKTSITKINIPNGVTSIGNRAFSSCTGLTSITIPDSVTFIDEALFHSCSGLTSVTISSDVTCISDYTFSYCSGLKRLNSDIDGVFNIPNGVTSIGKSTFYECSSLTSIDIPSGVTSIGSSAFWGCTSLTSITSHATIAPTIQNITFQDIKTGGTLTVPADSTGYDTWMGTGNYYLGKYGWTKKEQ